MRWSTILTIKCAKCKAKIMKYKKIGMGKVLRCWESKIRRIYDGEVKNNELVCKSCENVIGKIESKDKGKARYVNMDQDSFTYTGTKIKK
ncbi:MAG: hypothetical protein AWU54_287 [Candidatus Frackibacter sp. T328-2]|nr:MAG: hypothetical protein AWU54_287 [Candidatus Frackibacter sp. T328-2]